MHRDRSKYRFKQTMSSLFTQTKTYIDSNQIKEISIADSGMGYLYSVYIDINTDKKDWKEQVNFKHAICKSLFFNSIKYG